MSDYFTSLNSYPYWLNRPKYSDSVPFTFDAGIVQSLIAAATGLRIDKRITSASKRAFTRVWQCKSNTDRIAMLTHFATVQGAYGRFWMPTFIDEWALYYTTSGTSPNICTNNIGYANSYNAGDRVYIETTSGDRIIREVVSVSPGSADGNGNVNYENIQLDSGLPSSIAAGSIRTFCRLCLVKFTGTLKEKVIHAGATSGLWEFSAALEELPYEACASGEVSTYAPLENPYSVTTSAQPSTYQDDGTSLYIPFTDCGNETLSWPNNTPTFEQSSLYGYSLDVGECLTQAFTWLDDKDEFALNLMMKLSSPGSDAGYSTSGYNYYFDSLPLIRLLTGVSGYTQSFFRLDRWRASIYNNMVINTTQKGLGLHCATDFWYGNDGTEFAVNNSALSDGNWHNWNFLVTSGGNVTVKIDNSQLTSFTVKGLAAFGVSSSVKLMADTANFTQSNAANWTCAIDNIALAQASSS